MNDHDSIVVGHHLQWRVDTVGSMYDSPLYNIPKAQIHLTPARPKASGQQCSSRKPNPRARYIKKQNDSQPLTTLSPNAACANPPLSCPSPQRISINRSQLVLDGMVQRAPQAHSASTLFLLLSATLTILILAEPSSPQGTTKAAVVVEGAS